MRKEVEGIFKEREKRNKKKKSGKDLIYIWRGRLQEEIMKKKLRIKIQRSEKNGEKGRVC